MQSRHKPSLTILAVLLCLFMAQLACGPSSDEDQAATVEALAQSISLTATAGAQGVLSSEDKLKTAEAEATAESIAAEQTRTAGEALSAEARAATATAEAPILAKLPNYDLDPSEGTVGWIHPPASLVVDGYMSTDFENQFMGTIISDFVISADITWNTQYGTSGCGFVLRSDGKEEEGNQYMLILSRGAQGHLNFMTVANGELIDSKDIFVGALDPGFNWPNDSTNELTVIGRGNIFTIFSNGTLVGEVETGGPPSAPALPTLPPTPDDPSKQDQYEQLLAEYDEEVARLQANFNARKSAYEEYNTNFERGFVAMAVFSESGRTSCNFDDVWLVHLN
ncbi:MAG: hypothetical protein GTO18_07660 [Anaerolineales bacterium]|nr:hypothetical protein [Anaerolineales bacterium]